MSNISKGLIMVFNLNILKEITIENSCARADQGDAQAQGNWLKALYTFNGNPIESFQGKSEILCDKLTDLGLFTLNVHSDYGTLSNRLKVNYPEDSIKKIQDNLGVVAYKLDQLKSKCTKLDEFNQEVFDQEKFDAVIAPLLAYDFECTSGSLTKVQQMVGLLSCDSFKALVAQVKEEIFDDKIDELYNTHLSLGFYAMAPHNKSNVKNSIREMYGLSQKKREEDASVYQDDTKEANGFIHNGYVDRTYQDFLGSGIDIAKKMREELLPALDSMWKNEFQTLLLERIEKKLLAFSAAKNLEGYDGASKIAQYLFEKLGCVREVFEDTREEHDDVSMLFDSDVGAYTFTEEHSQGVLKKILKLELLKLGVLVFDGVEYNNINTFNKFQDLDFENGRDEIIRQIREIDPDVQVDNDIGIDDLRAVLQVKLDEQAEAQRVREAEAQRVAREAEAQRVREAEAQRVAREAEAQRVAREAEAQRVREVEAQRVAREAEAQRVVREAEDEKKSQTESDVQPARKDPVETKGNTSNIVPPTPTPSLPSKSQTGIEKQIQEAISEVLKALLAKKDAEEQGVVKHQTTGVADKQVGTKTPEQKAIGNSSIASTTEDVYKICENLAQQAQSQQEVAVVQTVIVNVLNDVVKAVKLKHQEILDSASQKSQTSASINIMDDLLSDRLQTYHDKALECLGDNTMSAGQKDSFAWFCANEISVS
jgi:hypothetical protein